MRQGVCWSQPAHEKSIRTPPLPSETPQKYCSHAVSHALSLSLAACSVALTDRSFSRHASGIWIYGPKTEFTPFHVCECAAGLCFPAMHAYTRALTSNAINKTLAVCIRLGKKRCTLGRERARGECGVSLHALWSRIESAGGSGWVF